MHLVTGQVKSPVGSLRFALTPSLALAALGFDEQWPALTRRLEARFGPLELRPVPAPSEVGDRLSAYLSGELDALTPLLVDPGGTLFQRRVWAALRRVLPGETTSYQQIARGLDNPRATRAVGTANGQNPVSLVIPCHRVVRSDGALSGYAGGPWRKRWLLDHESGRAR